MANYIYTVPLSEGLDANSNANLYIGGGANGQALLSDGAGNLNWGNVGTGNGTVTNIATTGNGLGFSLTGGPITTTGTITLTVPNATSLRSSLTIGNVANLFLNGNGSTVLAGNGAFIVPTGTYSNSNVANYLPTYTGNIGNSPVNSVNYLYVRFLEGINSVSSGNIIYAPNITANTILNAPTGNFTGNVSANIFNGNVGNIITINATTINGTTGNFTGNVSGGNANLGNLVTANFFSGNGYLLTGVTAANSNYANFAGNVVNSAQPNITSVGTLTSLSVSGNANIGNIGTTGIVSATGNITGNNITAQRQLISNIATGTPPIVVNSTTLVANLNVANANFATEAAGANAANFAANVTGAIQSNITALGTLSSLSVNGNVTANFYIGNGSQLSSITGANVTGTVANANYATNSGAATTANTVTNAAQSNITSLGTLTSLSVSGNANFSGNSLFTGANVSLGSVSNLKITGGNNSFYLQTDGTGNLTWAAGTGSGSGTAAGANTQIQYTDGAGNFKATAGFTFNSATGNCNMPGNLIVTDTINTDVYVTKTQITNLSANFNTANNINIDLLNGCYIINLDGFDYTGNTTTSNNKNAIFNLRGNANISLANLLQVGETITVSFAQRVKWDVTAFTPSTAQRTYSWGLSSTIKIDGVTITGGQGNTISQMVSTINFLGSYSGTISVSGSEAPTTRYDYKQNFAYITKLDSTPNWLIYTYNP